MRRDFRIGIGDGSDTVRRERLGEFAVVFDNSVMDDSNPPVKRDMGMGVGIGGRTVSGPTGVPDGHLRGWQGSIAKGVAQVIEAPGTLDRTQAFRPRHRYPGRVVAAVFQAG